MTSRLSSRPSSALLLSAVAVLVGFLFTAGPAGAATITTNATCALPEAIQAANTDTAVGGCAAGNGADVITLRAVDTLTVIDQTLPIITDDLIIRGAGNVVDIQADLGFVVSGANFTLDGLDVRVAATGVQVLSGSLTVDDTISSGMFFVELDGPAADLRIDNSSLQGFESVVGIGRDVFVTNTIFNGGQSAVALTSARNVVIERSYIASASVRLNSGTLLFENSIMWQSENGIAAAGGKVRSSVIAGGVGTVGGGVEIDSSIIAQGFECRPAVADGGANFVAGARDGEADCPPGFAYVNSGQLVVGAPADLGCRTETPTGCVLSLELPAGSPALGAAVRCTPTDIRGFERPATNCDSGATQTGATASLSAPTPVSSARCNGLPVTVNLALGQTPTDGDDVIMGTGGRDVIVARGGDDVICALGGNDLINAGTGADAVFAGGGDDEVNGGLGNDLILGGFGKDVLNGGNGNDRIIGGGDDDVLTGGNGNDTLLGRNGDDIIEGNNGNDNLWGENGDDRVVGGNGNDRVLGNAGNDVLEGGNGVDKVFGHAGDDLLRGGAGNDVLLGNAGADVLAGGGGNDSLNGGLGLDRFNGGLGNADKCTPLDPDGLAEVRAKCEL